MQEESMSRLKSALLCAVGVAAFAGAQDALGGTCTFDAKAHTVSVAMEATETATIYTLDGTIQYTYAASSSYGGGQCGTATVTNTDSITVTAPSGTAEDLTLSERNGPFAPGSKKEHAPQRQAVSEIEIAVDLGGADPTWPSVPDRLTIAGTDDSDVIALGSAGAALNADQDVDVTIANEPRIALVGRLGADTITAQGGYGAGTPYTAYPLGQPLEIYGGEQQAQWADGDNVLTGADGRDLIYGGLLGKNTISGYGGDDGLFGSWGQDLISGGAGNDSVAGDDGDDVVSGDEGDDSVDGGGGYDTIAGGAGNDMLSAHDYQSDTVDGGDGDDYANVDQYYDTWSNVETVSYY
jgi:Ca2+-binding RTX toxin-like protein